MLDRLYRSFEELVCQRGYDAVTLADIAKAAITNTQAVVRRAVGAAHA